MQNIGPDEVISVLKNSIDNFDAKTELEEVGRVVYVGDCIVRAYGLNNIKASELVEFADGSSGLAVNLEEKHVGIVLFGNNSAIKEGDTVKRTGKVLQIPIGKNFLGRVVDVLGRPIDNKGDIIGDGYKFLNEPAPGIIDRKSVHDSMSTGIKVIDSLIPIGKGQRELIIGDRKTGKTAILIDTIINQKKINDNANTDKEKVFCIYVAIGQKRSDVAQVVKTLEESGALSYTIVIAATASEAASIQFIAPYTGCCLGEYFRDEGMHAVVCYDDLSKHAIAYREISLLLRRPPGREAYPGDVFYLHSRLLERAAQMSDNKGGGSLTALPVIETQNNDVSAYIPTNVISITDGQIFLESSLFFQGIRPAVNIGLSVSRVGSAAQIKAMKQVAGSMKLELTQYREVAAFSQFASDVDEITRKMLSRGEKFIALLKQAQFKPLTTAEQVVIIFAGANDYLDMIDVSQIQKFEQQLLTALNNNKTILISINREKTISDDIKGQIEQFLSNFVNSFMLQG